MKTAEMQLMVFSIIMMAVAATVMSSSGMDLAQLGIDNWLNK